MEESQQSFYHFIQHHSQEPHYTSRRQTKYSLFTLKFKTNKLPILYPLSQNFVLIHPISLTFLSFNPTYWLSQKIIIPLITIKTTYTNHNLLFFIFIIKVLTPCPQHILPCSHFPNLSLFYADGSLSIHQGSFI